MSEDRDGVVGYEKTIGNRDGDFFFTAGAEKNIFDEGYTGSLGIKSTFADGGIAGLRKGYADGGRIGYNKGKAVKKVVNEGRRGFMKAAGAAGAGIAALKTGLLGFGEKVGKAC